MSNCHELSGKGLVMPLITGGSERVAIPKGEFPLHVCQLYNLTISQARLSCTNFRGFCRLFPTQAPGWVRGHLEVGDHWSGDPALTLDSSLTDSSRNILCPSPCPCHQVDDVKGRGKHWERLEVRQLFFVTF